MFKQIVLGIQECHEHNVIHRDIKLENIIVDKNKDIKIIDFGFSIIQHQEQKQTVYCGTPNYMAPELVQKKPYNGIMVDIWALGIFLYILLSGAFPFKAQDHQTLYKKITNMDYDFPSNVSSIPRTLISKILSKNPEDRPTCQQVYKVIKLQILQHQWFST